MLSVCRDYGEEVSIELGSDSSAAKGVLGRLGLGEAKHLEAGFLWISSFVDCQVFLIKRLCGKTQKSVDIGTSDLSEADM